MCLSGALSLFDLHSVGYLISGAFSAGNEHIVSLQSSVSPTVQLIMSVYSRSQKSSFSICVWYLCASFIARSFSLF